MTMNHMRLAGAAAALLLLAGCASLGPDGGIAPVQQAAREHLGQPLQRVASPAERAAREQRVAELLAAPLTAESALQIALLNHRGLQASLHALGVAEAEMVQASRLPNPGFSIARVRRGHEREIERSLGLDLGHLLALPLARAVESRRFAAAQQGAVLELLGLATEVRKAYYTAVAAQQSLRYQRDALSAAEAGAELAQRMARAGNWSRLQWAREQAFLSEAALNLAQAERAQLAARERLIRLLGLWGDQTRALALPERLPELPAAAQERPDIEQFAMARRIDLQAARLELEAKARGLGLVRSTRFVDALELGLMHNSSNEAERQTGYEIGFEIPLFDWGDARVARAQALYMEAAERAAQRAIEARSEVREAYLAYRSAHDVARLYREQIVPLAQQVSEQNLLRYNGMFIGVFELLADARAQIGAVNAAIQAQRDFWLAQADLEMALLGKPALSTASAPTAAAGPAAAAH